AAALARMRPLCLAEPGCLLWEAYHSQADAKVFVLVEHWQSRGHWEAHGQLAAIQTIYLPDVLPRARRAA
ncbi:antibiotic biosynthesis monooxygenase, partial [Chromobacterium piscinae]